MSTTRRLGLGFCVALAASASDCSLGENFVQCQVDSDCPTEASGSKLYCTQDNLCAIGTPAAKLCTSYYPKTQPLGAIVIGVLTNIASGSDALPVLAFEQAIDEINTARMSTGDRLLSLNLCEISATTDDAAKSMEILANQRGAVAVLGPSSSAYVQAIAKAVIDSQVPIMSQSATSPSITGLPGQGLFFRVAPADTLQGPALATQLPATSTKFDMLSLSDSYGMGLQQAFLAATTKMPSLSLTYTENAGTAAELMAQATALQMSANQIIADSPAPDHLIAITNNSTAQVVTDLLALSATTKIVMADGAKNQTLLGLLTGATTQMKTHLGRISGTAPTVDKNNTTGTGAYSNFKITYNQKWQQDVTTNNYIAYAYDAAYAVGIAIGAAGSNPTPANVSTMLLRLNGTTDHITVGPTAYLTSKNKLSVSGGLTLQGTTGPITFTLHGDRPNGLYEVWSVDTTNNQFISTQLP